MDKHNFAFRAVQMDLARQPETVAFIKERIDFIRRYDFNYLVLYLEGRIRTRSFHAFPENMSYSEEEIRDIVSYALSKGVQVIPVVSLFGHAEHFLNVPGFEPYGELQGNTRGRFGTLKHVFCPSNPETLKFLETYTMEVSELFPCEYFHAGFDEAWDIGYCEACKKRLEKEGQSGIFLSHLKNIHKIVTKKLHKTMMIWDDLYDIYPDALEKTPRDVILCAWHYDTLVELPFGHAGGPRSDHFALYNKLGFKVLFAPATYSFRNISSFTDYAVSRNTFGAFLTCWGDSNHITSLPSTAYAGMLWSPKFSVEEATPEAAIRETTRLRKKEETALAEYFLANDFFAPPANPKAYLRGVLNQSEFNRRLMVEAALALFEKYGKNASPSLKKILFSLEREKVYFELRKIIPALYDLKHRFSMSSELDEVKKQVARLNAFSKALEEAERPDRMNPRRTLDALEKMVKELPRRRPSGFNAFLCVRYPYVTTALRFFVRYKNASSWQGIEANFFGDSKLCGETRVQYPFEMTGEPEAVRIDDFGKHVGGSIMYLEIETADSRYVPCGIANLQGRVSRPEALLQDGRDLALFGDGEQQAFRKFNEPETVHLLSSVELLLKKM